VGCAIKSDSMETAAAQIRMRSKGWREWGDEGGLVI
jgi:hypothetical protein